MVFKWCGIAFQNIGPSTANDWSNRVWLAAELDRLLEGMTAKFPSLIWDANWMLRLLLVFAMKNFPHMEEDVLRIRLR